MDLRGSEGYRGPPGHNWKQFLVSPHNFQLHAGGVLRPVELATASEGIPDATRSHFRFIPETSFCVWEVFCGQEGPYPHYGSSPAQNTSRTQPKVVDIKQKWLPVTTGRPVQLLEGSACPPGESLWRCNPGFPQIS